MESGGTKRKGMGILLCVMVLFACACGEAWHARGAHAGGGGAYPNGAEGFLVGAAPPPGITFVNYLYYYHANEMMDDDGNGNPAFDEISVWAEVARFIWISKAQFLGANYGQHVFFLATDTDLDFTVPFGPKGDRHYHSTDIPYVIWSPCLLTWHLLEGRLHMVLDVADLYIPLSNEDKNDPSSLGRNFWTIEPVFAVTWLPAPAIELSAKFMYDFNTRQDDFLPGPPVNLDRTPGDEFHVDFAASYAVQPNLRLGVSGYYYRQVEDDDYHGLDAFPEPLRAALEGMEGAQSRVWALGPGVWYQRGNMMAEFRTQCEFDARNKTEGTNAWLKFYYVF